MASPSNSVNTFASLPDPGLARTLDGLVEGLRLLKVWAGDPSYESIKDRINAAWTAAGRPAAELAGKTTVVDCFRLGRRRLNSDLVIAVVEALHPEVGYVAQWRQALRVIGGETQAASQVRVQDTLPPDLTAFTGRVPELEQLRQACHQALQEGDAVAISAIEGMAGVGKTQLAVHAAHLLSRENAFDRVFFVNLRGFHPDPAQPPADPAAVLDGFLRQLGVPGQRIPHDLPARTAAYRRRLAGTRTLVILDNAAEAEQVRPLLPETPGCLTLVTSRRSLTDLHLATQLTVDVFTPDEAIAYLGRALPEVAVGSDPRAVARIAQHCGHLPLALGLIAGHIRGTPGWTLTDHADRLDERHRQLESGVELALNLSYQDLPADQRRLLRLASLHPGQDFDGYAAAALIDADLPTTQDHLHQLCREHLLQQSTPDRYSFHDLVRAYAAGRAIDEDRPPERRAALTRLLGYYVATAAIAMDVSYPYERQCRPTVAPTATETPDLLEQKRADLWLDTETANLLAAAYHAAKHGWPDHLFRLSAIVDRHLRTRGRYYDAQTLHEHALDLARHLGNRPAEMTALNGLGDIHGRLGHTTQACNDHDQALQIAQDIGDRVAERVARTGLSGIHRRLGNFELATDHCLQALQIAQEIGDRVGERIARGSLGDFHWSAGRFEQAAADYEESLQISQEIGDRGGEQSALTDLGDVCRIFGQNEQAGDHYARALQIAQDIGDRAREVHAIHGLGAVHRALGGHEKARDYYQQLLDLAGELGSRNWQYEAVQALGQLHHAAGQPELALARHKQALQYATDLTHPTDQARAHDGLGHAHHALGEHELARWHWQQALDILNRLGVDQAEGETTVAGLRANLDRQPQTGGEAE